MYVIMDTALPEHRKVRKLEKLLQLDNSTVIGALMKGWGWALTSAENGVLASEDTWILEDVAGWAGEPGRYIDALADVHLLDPCMVGYAFHDWANHGGRVIEERNRNRERMRANRAKSKEPKCGKRSTNVQQTCDANQSSNEVAMNEPAQEAALQERAASAPEEVDVDPDGWLAPHEIEKLPESSREIYKRVMEANRTASTAGESHE
jgi:hypothetical protein